MRSRRLNLPIFLLILLAPCAVSSGEAAAATCGNEIVETGEDCDDGEQNGSGSSCCAEDCQFKPDGNASCDGNDCTRPDTCTDGVCSPGACADGSGCTICGGLCVDNGSSCDCDFAPPATPTPTPSSGCPAGGVSAGGACWYFGLPPGQSCDAVCGALGLAYDDATRTFAGSDGSFENCTLVRNAVNASGMGTCEPFLVGDLDCSFLGGNAGIGCHCGPQLGFLLDLLRCAAPATTSSASLANRARYCACE